MIARGSFSDCEMLLRFQADLAQLEIGDHVRLVTLGNDSIGVVAKFPIAEELFRISMKEGMLHKWGWDKILHLVPL